MLIIIVSLLILPVAVIDHLLTQTRRIRARLREKRQFKNVRP